MEETLGTEASVGNRTDDERGINSDAVMVFCGKKDETDSQNVTSIDTKYFHVGKIVVPISFLSLRIPNKDTFDRPRRQFIQVRREVLNKTHTTKNTRSHGKQTFVRTKTRK